MTDTQTPALTENDDLVVIELDDTGNPRAPEGAQTPPTGAPADNGEGDDDGDDGDDRLAASADDTDEDVARRTRSKRRREHRKRADQLARIEREQLHGTVAALTQRLSQLEGHTIAQSGMTVEQRLQQKLGEIAQAEQIMAAAIAAGNGADAVTASRLKDAASAEANQLRAAKSQIEQQAQRSQPQQQTPTPAQPTVDPRVVSFATKWAEQNPWYDPKGADSNSTMTRLIDADLVREGLDPTTQEYWEELTARTAEELDIKPAKTARRNAPPVGGSREHVPTTTRKEIRVTPERKQAMIEAGAWDDPVKRQRMLKAYQEYDSRAAS